MGKASQERMTGHTYEERVERAKKTQRIIKVKQRETNSRALVNLLRFWQRFMRLGLESDS